LGNHKGCPYSVRKQFWATTRVAPTVSELGFVIVIAVILAEQEVFASGKGFCSIIDAGFFLFFICPDA